ncbi:SigE family RNA polymerase sigma factor [Actinoplanes sp. NPDC051859]|uniref:SigE family RNA polymerase sigma factor n=1 Tax=Actinoplanes sp. NPDC051859 TaxID=3363909 RepID=UPI003790471E
MRGERDLQFQELVVTERAGLLRTATLLTAGDGHLAEDLVQTVLTRVYVSWPAIQRAENRAAYLRRSLVNALHSERRRIWRRKEQTSDQLPDLPFDGGDEHPMEGGVRAALMGLPPRMRAAVVFRYFHDLSVTETAEALGCSEGTVKSQTARALIHLRAALHAPSVMPIFS